MTCNIQRIIFFNKGSPSSLSSSSSSSSSSQTIYKSILHVIQNVWHGKASHIYLNTTILDKTLCNTKKSTFIFPFSPFSRNQCCRVAIVGSLVQNPVFRCVIQHGMSDCSSVTLVLSTIVNYRAYMREERDECNLQLKIKWTEKRHWNTWGCLGQN